jgi:hypothetical protein
MHRKPAHFVCRVGFVLLCVLPTAAVAGWIVQRSLPGVVLSAKQEWEQELSRQLGLRVTCEAVAYPRHDTAELTKVAIVDPETGAPVASAATLEVVRTSDRWKLAGSQVVIETAQLPLLKVQFEQRWLRRETSVKQPGCEISFREVTLHDAARSLTLVDVDGAWNASAAGPHCELSFRLPEADRGAPRGKWLVQRNRQTSPPSTRWQLQTGPLPLPCSFVTAAWPAIKQLGIGAQFQGELDFSQTETLSGSVRGTIANIDLDALVSEQFPHKLSGIAICNIHNAEIENNKLRFIRGTLQTVANMRTDNNFISLSLLAAATENLQLITPPIESLPAGATAIRYRQLSLGFDLRDEGLQLTGSADSLREGVLIATASGSILEVPPKHLASAEGFFCLLVSTTEQRVPRSTSAKALARWLPMPAPPAQTGLARQPSHFPVRMQPTTNPQAPAVRQPNLR